MWKKTEIVIVLDFCKNNWDFCICFVCFCFVRKLTKRRITIDWFKVYSSVVASTFIMTALHLSLASWNFHHLLKNLTYSLSSHSHLFPSPGSIYTECVINEVGTERGWGNLGSLTKANVLAPFILSISFPISFNYPQFNYPFITCWIFKLSLLTS